MERVYKRVRTIKTKKQESNSPAYSIAGGMPEWNYNTSDENWKSITYLIRNAKNCN